MGDWRSVSVLIAGCGSIGRRHGRVLAGLGVRDLRACDPVPGQRAIFQGEVPNARLYDSYEAGLADHPDAVFVCTPTWMHVPMAAQALQADCHVLIEKPLSQSADGVQALAALAHERRKKVMAALCFRYHEGLLRARKYLHSGRIGRLVSIRALIGEHLPAVRPDYRNLFSSKYAGAFDLIHEVDLALWFAGLPMHRVLSISGTYSDIGIEAPDLAELLVEFADLDRVPPQRCLASIHLDFFQQPRRRQMELIGTRGTIIVEFARWEHCTVSVYEAEQGRWEHEELATQRDDMFRAEDREFLEAIVDDKPIACTVEEGLKSVEIVAQAYTFPVPPGGMT